MDTSMMECRKRYRHAAVLCGALLAVSACSSGGDPGGSVHSTIAMPTAAPSGRHFTMPSACVIATSHDKSLLMGGELEIRSHESSDDHSVCNASTAEYGYNRSATSADVHAWPIASDSVASLIKSGRCKEIPGVADTACMTSAPGMVHVYANRGNIDVVTGFRLLGLVKDPSKVPGYARHYAESVSRGIR